MILADYPDSYQSLRSLFEVTGEGGNPYGVSAVPATNVLIWISVKGSIRQGVHVRPEIYS